MIFGFLNQTSYFKGKNINNAIERNCNIMVVLELINLITVKASNNKKPSLSLIINVLNR